MDYTRLKSPAVRRKHTCTVRNKRCATNLFFFSLTKPAHVHRDLTKKSKHNQITNTAAPAKWGRFRNVGLLQWEESLTIDIQ